MVRKTSDVTESIILNQKTGQKRKTLFSTLYKRPKGPDTCPCQRQLSLGGNSGESTTLPCLPQLKQWSPTQRPKIHQSKEEDTIETDVTPSP